MYPTEYSFLKILENPEIHRTKTSEKKPVLRPLLPCRPDPWRPSQGDVPHTSLAFQPPTEVAVAVHHFHSM